MDVTRFLACDEGLRYKRQLCGLMQVIRSAPAPKGSEIIVHWRPITGVNVDNTLLKVLGMVFTDCEIVDQQDMLTMPGDMLIRTTRILIPEEILVPVAYVDDRSRKVNRLLSLVGGGALWELQDFLKPGMVVEFTTEPPQPEEFIRELGLYLKEGTWVQPLENNATQLKKTGKDDGQQVVFTARINSWKPVPYPYDYGFQAKVCPLIKHLRLIL